uniref:Ion_trans_2 domain-containing protein n=1 Tax=Syphacia muris TaxID=451379 RepID=A0A0N5A8C4_9BILA
MSFEFIDFMIADIYCLLFFIMYYSVKCERNVEKLDAHRSDMLNVLWAETMAQSEHDWAQMANQKLDIYERALLSWCAGPVVDRSPNTFKHALMQAFSFITTIGFEDANVLSTPGKIFAMLYSAIGIPLTLLYLGQCSKMLSGLASANKLLSAACIAIFVTAIVYDITEDSEEDTVCFSFFHCYFLVIVLKVLLVGFISILFLAVVSLSYIILQKNVEILLQVIVSKVYCLTYCYFSLL